MRRRMSAFYRFAGLCQTEFLVLLGLNHCLLTQLLRSQNLSVERLLKRGFGNSLRDLENGQALLHM